jgi:hypothetical protein
LDEIDDLLKRIGVAQVEVKDSSAGVIGGFKAFTGLDLGIPKQLDEDLGVIAEQLKNAKGDIQGAATATTEFGTAVDNFSAQKQITEINAAIPRIKAYTEANRLAAESAAAVPGAQGLSGAFAGQFRGGPVAGLARGGWVYRQGGGRIPSRGTDTVPTMLTPGEFVINARSARRFFPELQAINSGQRPVFRRAGGAVSNSTQIGDVVINVQGGGSPQATAKQINRELDALGRLNTARTSRSNRVQPGNSRAHGSRFRRLKRQGT